MKRILLVGLIALTAACGAPETKDEPETVIGTPPSPKDDPFFFVAMPAEAVPASTTGTIGPGDEVDAAETPDPAVGEPAPVEAAERAETPRPRASAGAKCFSCVRICPESVSDEDCGEEYDTICGWGRSSDRSVAAEIASAECNAALDLARDGSRYSRITGRCPVASCQ